MSRPNDGPAVEELDDTFEIVRATIGNTTFVIHELSITEYQKQIDKSRMDDDRVDSTLLLKLLVKESVRRMPKADAVGLTAAQCWEKATPPPPSFMAELPTKVARKLNAIVNDMHYGDIDTDEEREAAAASDGDSEKGEGEAS